MATPEKKTNLAATYAELSSEAYSASVSALVSANRRLLHYWRSVWEIESRPYASVSPESSVREGLERANQVLKLTVDELQAQRQESAKFTEQLSSQASKVKESSLAALSDVLDTAITDLNCVKDATSRNFEQLKKRLEELERHTTSRSN
ncbi:MAG: hypothetical protein WAJ85_01695 [Candidatus Baltobacteraceae bacterium]|jgi:polyhydroxyalkanoate synthesis regulator phasin